MPSTTFENATVLVIDDNPSICLALEILLSLHDITCLKAATPREGLHLIDTHDVDLVIQDMNFRADTTSGEEGEILFQALRQRIPDLPIILLTAWTHLDKAVQLIKAGAADYMAKPWDDARLIQSIKNLVELGQANRQLQHHIQRQAHYRHHLQTQFDLGGMVFNDSRTQSVVEMACQIAPSPVSVLITGPNGAGKEKIAHIIQANSRVKEGPFIVVNCGAIPADLIEAELFGAEAGAYTGANKARAGKFEAADGGTLFLDEIGNLPLAGQMKLLRVLETGQFQRLGSHVERSVRVRVVSATNADLPAMIKQGLFREDLYYRLNVIELRLPPLVERPDDIVPIAYHFLSEQKTLSPEAAQALLHYPWPGNVRELKNCMQRASLLARGDVITVDDLNLPATAIATTADVMETDFDRQHIENALRAAKGVIAQAAQSLGMSRQALYRRMEKLDIPKRPTSL